MRLRFARDERGQAVVLLGLALTGVLVGAGLGIDAGLEYVAQRREQVAADAAAYAAATSMAKNWGASSMNALAQAAALDYASRNGYDNDGVTNTVTVNTPPASGAYSGTTGYAEVVITVSVKTAFIRVLGTSYSSRSISARAVGGVVGPAKNYAIIALAKSGQSLSMVGNSQIEAENAGILVDSSGTPALSMTANTQIEGSVDVVGTAQAGGTVTGTVTTGAAAQPDPLAYLAAPTSCGTTYTAVNATGGTVTLQPGCYPSISASGNADVRLASGTYVITGGGISVTGNAILENDTPTDGVGVLVYNACANFPSTGGTCGAISEAGNGQTKLVGVGSGAYKGVSIWQPCANTQTLSVSGGGANGGIETTGSVYLPCAGVSVSGNNHAELEIDEPGGQLIASTISTAGKGEIEVEWDTQSTAPDRVPAIVE